LGVRPRLPDPVHRAALDDARQRRTSDRTRANETRVRDSSDPVCTVRRVSDEEPAPSRPGAGRAGASRRDYVGCGLWALGFLLLVVVSFSIGVALRPDSGGVDRVTLASGGSGDSGWQLEGYVDDDRDHCLTLYVDGDETTGQCGATVDAGAEVGRYLITSAPLPDGTTVAFAPLPRQAATVVLDLTDGTTATAEVRISETTDIRWFVHETDSEIAGPARVLDDAGEPLAPG